jgi:hypothetical protein
MTLKVVPQPLPHLTDDDLHQHALERCRHDLARAEAAAAFEDEQAQARKDQIAQFYRATRVLQ